MHFFDRSLPAPAANLACDEALLDYCENTGAETLRFWASDELFVALGFSNSVATEVNQKECERAEVGIYRRCSGGGTVLQGPGCLNYSLALRSDRPGTETIPTANHSIMERHRAALTNVVGRPVEICGHTDLAVGGLKFSGNAQRRKRRALLFHGTFLLDFDLPLMERFLAMPSRQPEYRADRPHGRFVTNLGVTASAIKAALRRAWHADTDLATPPDWQRLAAGKYSRDEWNFKF